MAFQISLMLFTSLFFFFLPLHLSAFCSFSSVTKISYLIFLLPHSRSCKWLGNLLPEDQLSEHPTVLGKQTREKTAKLIPSSCKAYEPRGPARQDSPSGVTEAFSTWREWTCQTGHKVHSKQKVHAWLPIAEEIINSSKLMYVSLWKLSKCFRKLVTF